MAKIKKISKIQIFRVFVQILFLILLPGLYASALAGIKTIYLGIVNQNFDIAQDFPAILGALSVLPATILLGRFFCGWMCSFGAMGDWLYALSKNVFHIKFKMNDEMDRKLKLVKYVILILLFVLIWNIDFEFLNSANPWNAFGVIATVTKIPDIGYAIQNFALGTIILALIIVGSMLVERFFCRYLCPLGAVFTILSRCRLIKVKKPGKDCGSCRLCTSKCSMGIPLYKMDKVNSGECIQCLKCVTSCPRKNAYVSIASNEINPGFAGAMAAIAMTGIYYTGSAISDTTANSGFAADSLLSQAQSGKYKDGTYEGTGTGFRGATTKVSVTVENGNITDIEAVSYGDDTPYFNRAFSSITQEIVDSQSTDVDAVSGATYSSNGIMSAVADALDNAGGSSDNTTAAVTEAPATPTTKPAAAATATTKPTTEAKATVKPASTVPVTEEPATANESSSTSASGYTDGTYTGTGTGFRGGTTKMSVTVANGQITDIQAITYGDDAPFFKKAYSYVVSEIINNQSTDVDGVSGATYSSNGIMEAVADALDQAQ